MEKEANSSRSSNSCSMVGFVGIIIQLALGALSFSILIIKRFRQKPKRPWKIWFFDTSKQLISQIIAHFINLAISLALASKDSQSDECLWYFMTNIMDNTFGVFVCILCLKGIQFSLLKRGKLLYMSGNYYSKQTITVQVQISNIISKQSKQKQQQSKQSKQIQMAIIDQGNQTIIDKKELLDVQNLSFQDKDSRVHTLDNKQPNEIEESVHQKQTQQIDKYRYSYDIFRIYKRAWVVQLLIWISVVTIGKCMIFGFQIGLEKPLNEFSFLILGWIKAYPYLQLIFVMVIVPVIMNGFAFWIQDNFLKKKQETILQGQSKLVEQINKRQQQLEQQNNHNNQISL